jgi:hypothetical protein
MTEAERLYATWRPRAEWAAAISPVIGFLEGEKPDAAAWRIFANMLGESGANAMAVWVCLLARDHFPGEAGAFVSHLAQGLAEFHLGSWADGGRYIPNWASVTEWLARELAPFAEKVPRAVGYAVRLAGLRTGALPGPEPSFAELTRKE